MPALYKDNTDYNFSSQLLVQITTNHIVLDPRFVCQKHHHFSR